MIQLRPGLLIQMNVLLYLENLSFSPFSFTMSFFSISLLYFVFSSFLFLSDMKSYCWRFTAPLLPYTSALLVFFLLFFFFSSLIHLLIIAICNWIYLDFVFRILNLKIRWLNNLFECNKNNLLFLFMAPRCLSIAEGLTSHSCIAVLVSLSYVFPFRSCVLTSLFMGMLQTKVIISFTRENYYLELKRILVPLGILFTTNNICGYLPGSNISDKNLASKLRCVGTIEYTWILKISYEKRM